MRMSGGVLLHRPPLRLGRVPGPQADRDVGADPPQRRPQVALDVVGERLQRRDVDEPHARGRARRTRERRSMPQRKLARVLPEPVGAQISVLAPLEIASQPPAWAGVGPSKEASNQRRTGRAERRQRVRSRSRFRHRWPTHRSYAAARPRGRSGLAAGELHVGLPRRLRHEACAEEAGAAAEVAGPGAGRRPRTRRPAAAATSPAWLLSRLKAPLSWVAWPLGPLAKPLKPLLGDWAARAPAELGDPEALAGIVVGLEDRRAVLRCGRRCSR